jgi:arginyl-tRNA synthetase
MKDLVANRVRRALDQCLADGALSLAGEAPEVVVERPGNPEHGDWATNLAMVLAKPARMNPRQIAGLLTERLDDEIFSAIEVAGPGFINFRLAASAFQAALKDALGQGPDYGRSDMGQSQKVQVEFVSANPTGPLHVGHGRGAAVGDAVANLLAFTGHVVEREYYINDAGNQMATLGRSVWHRLAERLGREVEFPADHYQGDYIRRLAADFLARHPEAAEHLPDPAVLGEFAARAILRDIRSDLDRFGVKFDHWLSERSLFEAGGVEEAIEVLRQADQVYDQDGATWFKATNYGDEKDRVLVKADGATTYFASDVAYHWNKWRRGFTRVIDVWGADHHGYVPRLQAVVKALPFEATPEQQRPDGETFLDVILVQLVNLLRGGEPVAMSTRAGQFVTLAEVLGEVGPDAARFIFLTRKADAPLDFDLEVAKSQSLDNPVYYVQYAHARLCNIFVQAGQQGLAPPAPDEAPLHRLELPSEWELISRLTDFPELVKNAARNLAPHRVTFYLTELAGAFHRFYYDRAQHQVVSDDRELSLARLALCRGLQNVIKVGLGLLGVNAPERM